MSYIAFELDAFDAAESAARHAGTEADRIMAGLLRLWRFCWRQKADHVSGDQLRGIFGLDVALALVAFGFIEPVGDAYRVKGADRYLRVQEGRSKGGRASAGNLKRGTQPPGCSPAAPRLTPGLVPADSRAFTDERAANSEQLQQQKKAPRTKRADAPPAADGFRAKTDALCDDFEAVVREKYLWSGTRDTDALKRLLSAATLEEVRARWRRGLELGDKWPGVRTIGQLALRWNDLGKATTPGRDAPDKPRPEGRVHL